MNYEEILSPVSMYRSRLREEHDRNSAEAFDELLRRSGIDEAANRELVERIRKLEDELSQLNGWLAWWTLFRCVMWLIALFGALVVVLGLIQLCSEKNFHVTIGSGVLWCIVATAAFLLIFKVLNPKIKLFDDLVAERQRTLQARMEEAWAMMEPLNRLYRWDMVTELVMKTLPILAIDRYVSLARLRQLVEHFQWAGCGDDTTSVLACQSGAVNGNPWGVVEELRRQWGTKSYVGSKVITWQEKEYYTDSEGHQRSRWVTRSETLVATIERPIPVYDQNKRLVYGNEAAPELNFSREPNSLSGVETDFLGKTRMKAAIAALERKSRDLDNTFTIMDNREFDACFNAIDRDNEQQFRLLFTPLAQQEMLHLLRDRENGYGDDFFFVKSGMINTLCSSHLEQLDISASPQLFRSYDLDTARRNFISYSNEFFRSFFFSFAPLFCIPLYQQHRNFQDIYAGVIDSGEVAFVEYESLVNAIGEAQFRPADAVTQSILKTDIARRSGQDVTLTVTAHAFRGKERIEFVPRFGGDGRWHQVPVPWIEYLPISRCSQLMVSPAGTGDHLEFAEKLDTPEWRKRLRSLNADGQALLFRRGLAAFSLNR